MESTNPVNVPVDAGTVLFMVLVQELIKRSAVSAEANREFLFMKGPVLQ
jgi:hypothetical protein